MSRKGTTETKQEVTESVSIETNVEQSPEYEINSTNYYFGSEILSTGYISLEQMKDYVKHPMIHNRVLRKVSREAYSANGQYMNFVENAVASPTLSYISLGRQKTDVSRKAKKKIDLLMKKIMHKRTTRDMILHAYLDGMYVGILRDTKATNKDAHPQTGFVDSMPDLEGLSLDENMMLQPLNLDYCKVIGFSNNVNIAAFNMQYFEQFKHGGLLREIKNFPPEFRKAWLDYKKDASKQWYVLDPNTTICIKAKANLIEPYGRPCGIAAFADMKHSDDYEAGQQKIVEELASSIYTLLLPEGEKKGVCSLNKDQQKALRLAFEDAVKINNTGNRAKVSTLTLPPGAELDKIKKDAELLDDKYTDSITKKISTSIGMAASILNGEANSGSNYASLKFNMDIILAQVFKLLEDISSEYTRVLNSYLSIPENNYIDIKYLPISHLNQSEVYDRAKELYTLAGGSKTYMLASAGFDPEDYLAMCDYEIDEDFDEKYKPHPTSYTISDSADKPNPSGNVGIDKGGRPTKNIDEMSGEGIRTRGNGDNEGRR